MAIPLRSLGIAAMDSDEELAVTRTVRLNPGPAEGFGFALKGTSSVYVFSVKAGGDAHIQ